VQILTTTEDDSSQQPAADCWLDGVNRLNAHYHCQKKSWKLEPVVIRASLPLDVLWNDAANEPKAASVNPRHQLGTIHYSTPCPPFVSFRPVFFPTSPF
jgi:hypothetical protein